MIVSLPKGLQVKSEDDFTADPSGTAFPSGTDDPSGTETEDPSATITPTDTTISTIPPFLDITPGPPTDGICLMIYQVADNDLEYYSRGDLYELTRSPITRSSLTVTWVYHDALNEGSPYYTEGPLEDVYNPDGTPLTQRFDGSRYLTWDHDLGKMVVDTIFPTELNSDRPAVLQAFIQYALADCILKGKSDFFLVLSSHGAGFAGFGGDYNTRRRARKLVSSNPEVYMAIQGALASVTGAPLMLDVLGFDACLMQSLDTIDNFANITRYYLASEATEPGHGWAYDELTATTNSLDLALSVLDTFLASTHGAYDHETPKTMAVVDTAAYPAFRDAWDAMCSAMADILASGNDADFHASLMRARANTQSFAGFLDGENLEDSAIDIGDFFAQFIQLCNPDESSELYMLMINASDAYFAQFVAAGVGPGTANATGMHITWVSKQDFLNDQEGYKASLFMETGTFPILDAPNYWRLLEAYFYTSTPTDNFGTSVCQTSSKSSRSPISTSTLLIDPTLVFLDLVNVEVRSEITRNVDYVFVEYGIDLTYLLQDDGLRRRLDESVRRQQARRLEAAAAGKQQRSSFARRRRAMKWRQRDNHDRSRRLQNDTDFGIDDYFLIYGGDVAVDYNGPNIVANWDSTFFWIQNGDDLEPVYAYDDGGGLKSIPVCYFNQNNPISSLQISLGITVDDAMEDLGCEYGFLSFSVANDSMGKVTLYVYRGNSLSSVAAAAGRNIVPISYIEYSVGDEFVDELLGGFSAVVVPWTPESNFSFFSLSDFANLEEFGSSTAFLEIQAYDNDANVTDGYFLPYIYEVNGTDSDENRRRMFIADPGADVPNLDLPDYPADDLASATRGDVHVAPLSSGTSTMRTSLDVGTCAITALIMFFCGRRVFA